MKDVAYCSTLHNEGIIFKIKLVLTDFIENHIRYYSISCYKILEEKVGSELSQDY